MKSYELLDDLRRRIAREELLIGSSLATGVLLSAVKVASIAP